MKSNHLIIFLVCAISILLGYFFAQKVGLIKNSSVFEVARDNNGIDIQIANKLVGGKSGCEKYQFIELQFVGNLGENLRILTKCMLDKDGKNINSFKIPFQHLFTFPSQSGEFTTKSETKVYVSNHKAAWSNTWKLKSFHFVNSSSDRLEVHDKKLILDTESLLDAAATRR